MTIPLAALVVLVVVIVIGALLAKHRGSSDNGLPALDRPMSSLGLLLPADVMDTYQTHSITAGHGRTTEGWNW